MTVTISRRGMALVVENMLLKIGTRAMMGMALTATATGVVSSPRKRNRLASAPAATPNSVPRTSPTRALVPVTRAACTIPLRLASI